MLPFEDILSIIKSECNASDPVVDENSVPRAVKISPADLKNVCLKLYQDASVYFDMLTCITGVDNGAESQTMEVIYHLYSIPFNHSIVLKVTLPRTNPEIESVTEVWKTANWHERELYDMLGIHVKGHPDLRRILMPADWDGHPLRKDYKQQEYYRDIKVAY